MSEENSDSLDQKELKEEQDIEIDEDLQEPEEDPANVVFENGKGYVASEDADRL